MRRSGLVWLAGGVLGLTAEWVGFGWGDPREWIPDLAVGWSFIGCGLVASGRRPQSRTGLLLAATGFTWFLGNFADVGVAAVAWAAAHLVYLYRGPLVQLLLGYPSGRSGSRLVRGAVAVGYAVAVITPIWRSAGATILLAGLLLAVRAREYARAVGPLRRACRVALQAAAGLSVVLAGTAAARLLLPPGEVSGPALLVYEATLCVLAVCWRACWSPRGNGRPSPTSSSSWARRGRARCGASWRERLATRPSRSATGCRTGRCSSMPGAVCSPCPVPVRGAR